MTDTRYKRMVAKDDSKWRLEAVQFDSFDSDMTRAYPRWFIDMLTGQHPKGYGIQFHAGMQKWFLRNPTGPDYELAEGDWVCQNMEGMCFKALSTDVEGFRFRLHDEEHDGPW